MSQSADALIAEISPQMGRELERLRAKGGSVSSIAKRLGIAERAVANYLGVPWGLSPSTVIRRSVR